MSMPTFKLGDAQLQRQSHDFPPHALKTAGDFVESNENLDGVGEEPDAFSQTKF